MVIIIKKRAQVFSIDLIFAVVIFLVAVSLFYFNFVYIPEQRIERRLQIDTDFLFQNIEENTKVYDGDISFIDGFRIDKEELTNFAQIKYKNFQKILFENIIITGLDVDACLYFTNSSDFIVPIYNGIAYVTGIGNSTNEFIIIEDNDESTKEDDIWCGGESKNTKANPYCYGNYEYTRLFTKPVLKKTEKYSEIITMNVLVCARQKGSTLFLEKPGPSCFDGIKNQDEEGIDCGGPCPDCPLPPPPPPPCAGDICLEEEDCPNDDWITIEDRCCQVECIIPEITHTECDDNTCKVVTGAGTDECTTDTDCVIPEVTHTKCEDTICNIIAGEGTSECLTNDDCAIPPEETHTKCDGTICKVVAGAGASECVTDANCVTPPPEVTHTECSSTICIIISGEGTDECTTDSDCAEETHSECDGTICRIVVGEGASECTLDTDCALPEITHAECDGTICRIVTGEGTDECTTDSNCIIETHTECNNNICKVVTGAGTDECTTDTDCVIPEVTHTKCEDTICKIIAGEGTSECLTNDDCAAPPKEEIPPEAPICFKTNYGIEICGNNIDEDCDGIKRACPPGCKPRNSGIEICGNEIDEDCNGKDKECSVPGCIPKNSGIEICNNEIDEDCDGKDKECVVGCIPVNNAIEICGNNIDENCDGFDDACISIEFCTTRECRLTSGTIHKKKPVWFGFLFLILFLFVFVILLIAIHKFILKRSQK